MTWEKAPKLYSPRTIFERPPCGRRIVNARKGEKKYQAAELFSEAIRIYWYLNPIFNKDEPIWRETPDKLRKKQKHCYPKKMLKEGCDIITVLRVYDHRNLSSKVRKKSKYQMEIRFEKISCWRKCRAFLYTAAAWISAEDIDPDRWGRGLGPENREGYNWTGERLLAQATGTIDLISFSLKVFKLVRVWDYENNVTLQDHSAQYRNYQTVVVIFMLAWAAGEYDKLYMMINFWQSLTIGTNPRVFAPDATLKLFLFSPGAR